MAWLRQILNRSSAGDAQLNICLVFRLAPASGGLEITRFFPASCATSRAKSSARLCGQSLCHQRQQARTEDKKSNRECGNRRTKHRAGGDILGPAGERVLAG